MRIGLVADSTSDLPESVVREYGINVVPLLIRWDGKEFKDGVEITRSEFYQKLRSSSTMPSTSQPSPGDFVEHYKALLEEYDQIISIHISSKLSGTVQSARIAQEMLDAPIHIVDSLSTTMGLGSLVINAARLIRQGMGVDAVISEVERLKKEIQLIVSLNTLEYLERGGRIGKVTAFLGSLLHIKPLIEVADGRVHPLGRARSRKEAVQNLVQRASGFLESGGRFIVSIMHTDAEEEAQAMLERIRTAFPKMEYFLEEAGPILGCHVGPEALGIVVSPSA